MLWFEYEARRRGMTWAKLGRLSGIPQTYLSRVAHGHMKAFPGWQERISRVLGLPVKVLFSEMAVGADGKATESRTGTRTARSRRDR